MAWGELLVGRDKTTHLRLDLELWERVIVILNQITNRDNN